MAKNKKPQKITKKIHEEILTKFRFPKVFGKQTGYNKARELGFSTDLAKNIKTRENLENLWNARESFRSTSVAEYFYRETYGKGSKTALKTETRTLGEYNNFINEIGQFMGLNEKETSILKMNIAQKDLMLSDFENKKVRDELLKEVKNGIDYKKRKEFYSQVFAPIAIANLMEEDIRPIVNGYSRGEKYLYTETNRLAKHFNMKINEDGHPSDKVGFAYANRIIVLGESPQEAFKWIDENTYKSSVLPDKIIYDE
jgi:hypothetical protein